MPLSSQLDTFVTTNINEREFKDGDGAGDGSPRHFTRPAESDDLLSSPPDIARAYERNAQTDVLAFVASEVIETLISNSVLAKIILEHFMTYLTPRHVRAAILNCMTQVEEINAQRVSLGVALESRFHDLDLQTLEQEMVEIIQFRREDEELGSPG